MATTTTLQVLQGIQTRLDTIAGLRPYDVIDGTPNPPCALILPTYDDYHSTLSRDDSVVELSVVVHCISDGATRSAQLTAYGWCDHNSSTSVRKAIEDAPTLGGVACDSMVTSARAGFVDENGLQYFGARFDVRVLIQ